MSMEWYHFLHNNLRGVQVHDVMPWHQYGICEKYETLRINTIWSMMTIFPFLDLKDNFAQVAPNLCWFTWNPTHVSSPGLLMMGWRFDRNITRKKITVYESNLWKAGCTFCLLLPPCIPVQLVSWIDVIGRGFDRTICYARISQILTLA